MLWRNALVYHLVTNVRALTARFKASPLPWVLEISRVCRREVFSWTRGPALCCTTTNMTRNIQDAVRGLKVLSFKSELTEKPNKTAIKYFPGHFWGFITKLILHCNVKLFNRALVTNIRKWSIDNTKTCQRYLPNLQCMIWMWKSRVFCEMSYISWL